MTRLLSLRVRWALWVAALVLVTGVVVLAVATISTDRLLRDRAREIVTPPGTTSPTSPAGQSGPGGPAGPGGPGGPAGQTGPAGGTGGPLPGPAATPDPARTLDAGGEITERTLHDVRIVASITVAFLVVLAVAVAWLVAGQMLRPIRKVTDTARKVTGAGDQRRIALQGPPDELKALADTIDAMLDRVEATHAAQRRFVADASHELRTPLATMRVEVDVALDNANLDPEELRDALGEIGASVERAQRLTDSLLLLARSGAVQQEADLDLADAASHAVDTLSQVDGTATFVADLSPAPTRGDIVLIERMATNLVENAVRYRTPGTPVRVSTSLDAAAVHLTVENDGPVVDDASIEAWFDRFRRSDDARDRVSGGAGLGLSIVRAVAEAHGGSVLGTAMPAGGVRITVTLPAR